ncbi:S49 family peptidase, partial [Desulfovibrio oxamicus]
MPNSLFAERLWAIQPDALAPFLSHVRGMVLSRPASPPDKLARHEPSGGSALPPAGGFTPHAAFALGGEVLRDKPYAVVNGVAVISIRGVLSQFAVRTYWGELVATGMLDQIRPAIAAALADNAVGAVLLDINSPGGTVAGMKELSDFTASAGKAAGKPMAAYANGTMASAAYSLGASTGRVFAPATASVGSIGIISVLPNWAGWNEKMGVSYAYLTAGKWKAVGNEDNPLTDQERAYIQARLDTLYQHFTDGVASGMGLDVAALGTWADGQIFIASAAPQGLVTAIVADLETAIATLAKETTMDKATLAAQHPEVLASITREAAEQATAQAATQHAAQLKDRTEACVAAVRATAG